MTVAGGGGRLAAGGAGRLDAGGGGRPATDGGTPGRNNGGGGAGGGGQWAVDAIISAHQAIVANSMFYAVH
uniref:PE family protein n=1 Tax=Ascaris lumbricoides TaxID=6252 RepID=A0A0M3IGL8_ASCLU